LFFRIFRALLELGRLQHQRSVFIDEQPLKRKHPVFHVKWLPVRSGEPWQYR